MTKLHAGLLAAALSAAVPSAATPITFTTSVTGSGTIGGQAFTDRLITLAGVGDTSDQSGFFFPGDYQIPGVTASLSVAGLGTFGVTDALRLFVNQGVPDVGVTDLTADDALLFTTSAAAASYDLTTSIGSITGAPVYLAPYSSVGTSGGAFTLAGVSGAATFQAEIGAGAVPEPATWGMMILGFAVLGSALRGRRRATVRLLAA